MQKYFIFSNICQVSRFLHQKYFFVFQNFLSKQKFVLYLNVLLNQEHKLQILHNYVLYKLDKVYQSQQNYFLFFLYKYLFSQVLQNNVNS